MLVVVQLSIALDHLMLASRNTPADCRHDATFAKNIYCVDQVEREKRISKELSI